MEVFQPFYIASIIGPIVAWVYTIYTLWEIITFLIDKWKAQTQAELVDEVPPQLQTPTYDVDDSGYCSSASDSDSSSLHGEYDESKHLRKAVKTLGRDLTPRTPPMPTVREFEVFVKFAKTTGKGN